MKIDLSAPIKDLANDFIKDGDKDLVLSAICCSALLTPDPKEGEVSPEEKIKRFRLATKIYDGGLQDLSAEDVAMLKKLIGRAFPPLVVGRAFDILDP